MGKGEISWKGHTPEGLKREVYARRTGGQWRFFIRQQRYDQWQSLLEPPLEDWLQLLDGVRRRIARRLVRPEEEPRLRKLITERFPETEF
jgi:hypothetical protein